VEESQISCRKFDEQKMKTTTAEKSTDKASGLTDNERKKIANLEKTVEAIDGQLAAVRGASREEKADQAHDKYIQDPTDENFAFFKAAIIERENLLRIGKISRAPETALDRVVKDEIQPFLAPIISRLHTHAKAHLDSVTETEAEKHFDLTGIKQPFTSTALEPARKAVEKIEEISAAVFSPDAGQIRKAFAALKNYSAACEKL
jgi:hypothetical protein